MPRCCNGLTLRLAVLRGTSDDADHSSAPMSMGCRSIGRILERHSVCWSAERSQLCCQQSTKQSDYAIFTASCRL